MNDLSPSAGVDVGSLWLDLGFHPFAKPIRAPNTEAGIETILAALRERGVGKLAIEAIGGYARKLARALIEAEVKVFLANPRRIKAFRDAEGLIAKTDKLDASLIARFAQAMDHELRPLRDVEHEILKALSTRRRQLTESIAIEQTRVKQAFDPRTLELCREMIAILQGKRRTIEAELDRRNSPSASQPSSSSRCRSSASSAARRRPAWRALRPIPRNPAWLVDTTPSPAAVPACAQPSTWPRSSRCEPIPASSRSTSACPLPENPQKSPSSPSLDASSPSPTPSSAMT